MGEVIITGSDGQGQTGNDHSGYGTTAECHGKTGCHATFGGLCCSDIRENRHAHADISSSK